MQSTWKNVTDPELLSDALYSGFVGGLAGSVLALPYNINTAINNKNNVNLPTVDSETSKNVNLPSVNNTETIIPTIANQKDINYNTIKGDIIDKRARISDFKENERDVGRGVGTISTNEGVSNILQESNKRNNKNPERASIEQDYGTVEERRKYFERVKNNMIMLSFKSMSS